MPSGQHKCLNKVTHKVNLRKMNRKCMLKQTSKLIQINRKIKEQKVKLKIKISLSQNYLSI